MGLNFNQGPLSYHAWTEGKDGADHSTGISFLLLVPSAANANEAKEQIMSRADVTREARLLKRFRRKKVDRGRRFGKVQVWRG